MYQSEYTLTFLNPFCSCYIDCDWAEDKFARIRIHAYICMKLAPYDDFEESVKVFIQNYQN